MPLLEVGTKIHNHKDGTTVIISDVDYKDEKLPYEVTYVSSYDENGEPIYQEEWFPEFVTNWWLDNPNVEIMK